MIKRIIKWVRAYLFLDIYDDLAKAAEDRRDVATGDSYVPPVRPYVDKGVYYFYAEPGRPSERMRRAYKGKANQGTYRFDPNGTYYFNKKDKGTAVVIVFAEYGKLQRRTVTI